MNLDLVSAALVDTVTEFGSSRYAEYRRCPRAHWLRYEQGIRLAPRDETLDGPEGEPSYFLVGRLCHAVLRYMQEGVLAREPSPRPWHDVIEVAQTLPEFDVQSTSEASRLMGAYFMTYGDENAGWPEEAEILGVEVPYESTIGGSRYTGRVDTLIRIRDRILIVDTKTRSKAFPQNRDAYVRGAATRPQFLGLAHLVQEAMSLESPPSIWLNAIIKTKSPKFDRMIVPISAEALEQWKSEQTRFLPVLGDDRMNYSACAPEGYGAKCSYFNWCHIPSTRETHYVKQEQQ